MNCVQSLSHSKWECKYQVRWIPKYRKKQIYEELRKPFDEVLRDLARREECKISEGHLMPDHARMLISIPPKYAVSQIIGFKKGKRRYISQEKILAKEEAIGDNISGPEDIMFRPQEKAKKRFGTKSGHKKKRIKGPNS